METVETTISALRRAVHANTDTELAKKLGVDKSTISGWRSRGRVPERIARMVQTSTIGAGASAPTAWPELESAAQPLALARFTVLRSEVAFSGDTDWALSVFRDRKPFWFVLYRAYQELRQKMDALSVDLVTAQALLMQEDLRDPEATKHRIADQLEKDFRDNPHF